MLNDQPLVGSALPFRIPTVNAISRPNPQKKLSEALGRVDVFFGKSGNPKSRNIHAVLGKSGGESRNRESFQEKIVWFVLLDKICTFPKQL